MFYAQAGDLEDLMRRMDDTVCAVMLECVQGEGGVVALDFEYLRAVDEAVPANGIVLLLVDEVQTGAGRTGQLSGLRALRESGQMW